MSSAHGYAAPRPGGLDRGGGGEHDMPSGLNQRALRRRLLIALGLLAAIVALITLLPGLTSLRHRFAHAQAGWLVVGVGLKLLSGLSYVVIFRAVFCSRMTWRRSYAIGMSELGANALFPTGGAGGLALGAWALRRSGMASSRIARRTVAFFFLTSAANVAGVAVLGIAIALGLFGTHQPLGLTVAPAAAAVLAIVGIYLLGRWAGRLHVRMSQSRAGSKRVAALGALADGVNEAFALLREHDWQLIAGAVGYLAFDVMILWATFHAFGSHPDLAIIWIAYLIGELGGLIPVPGGIGGVDAGLVGTLVLYGVGVTPATAAVLAYRTIALWVPALFGASAFVALRRALNREDGYVVDCGPDTTVGTVGAVGAVDANQTRAIAP